LKLTLLQIDAFTDKVFGGNPAAVCPLDDWLSDEVLQKIAAENNLSETAFFVKKNEAYELRWFTPKVEVDLCGHATLASAFVLFACQKWPEENIHFRTRKSGQLVVAKRDDLLEMDFPSRPAYARTPPAGLKEALRVAPKEIFGSAEDLLVVLDSEEAVLEVQPDFGALEEVECRGTIITARGDRSDFVSRFFAPRVGIPEDSVTGSAHCVLIPYWASVLRKNDLHAFQISKRGGELFCTHVGERVKISGKAALYMEGTITI